MKGSESIISKLTSDPTEVCALNHSPCTGTLDLYNLMGRYFYDFPVEPGYIFGGDGYKLNKNANGCVVIFSQFTKQNGGISNTFCPTKR